MGGLGRHGGGREHREAASVRAFARGECLSEAHEGDAEPHRWRCARGHEFEATPTLLILGGYWCFECAPSVENLDGWNYDTQAAVDPLLKRFHRQT